jgi:RHS repeat-associated protein
LQFDKTGSGDVEIEDLSHRYLWGPAVDELLADEQVDWSDEDADGEVLWALTDHLGSVRDVANNSGSVVNHISYDSFGNVTGETDPDVDVAFGYTGKLFDDATGLQNNLNRWYDAQTGEWISQDFIWDGTNRSAYVGNGSTMFVDPDGLDHVTFEVLLNPGKVDSMPWHDERLGNDSSGQPIYGQIRITKFDVHYKIERQGDQCHITIVLDMEIRVFIDVSKHTLFRATNRREGDDGLRNRQQSVETTYGHEQQHAKNLIESINKYVEEEAAIINSFYKLFPSSCDREMLRINAKLLRANLINEIKRIDEDNSNHKFKDPGRRVPYNPIGPFPPKPSPPGRNPME